MLRKLAPREIHIRINSPEVIWPCFYGIDTDAQSQLISANKTVDEILRVYRRRFAGFPSVEGLRGRSCPGRLLRCVFLPAATP